MMFLETKFQIMYIIQLGVDLNDIVLVLTIEVEYLLSLYKVL